MPIGLPLPSEVAEDGLHIDSRRALMETTRQRQQFIVIESPRRLGIVSYHIPVLHQKVSEFPLTGASPPIAPLSEQHVTQYRDTPTTSKEITMPKKTGYPRTVVRGGK